VTVSAVVGVLALAAAGQVAPRPGSAAPAVKPATPGGAATGTTAPAPDAASKDAPLTAPELEAKLKATAASGKYADTLPGQFVQYADLVAREKLVPSAVSEEFWTWLAGNKVLHKAVLVNLHPKYDPAMVKLLSELHEKFPADVDKYPHLALAFALNGAAAGKRPVTAGWARSHRDLAGIPPLQESFQFYVTNAKRMIYPLDKLPWPLMVYVADNDVPLAERTWAMTRYGQAQPEAFGKIYYEVPYDMEGAKKANDQSGLKVNSAPYTLENILLKGGVCADRAYYASRILKTLGIPAFYDAGEGARGGHAWVAWLAVNKGQLALVDSGRFDFDRYFTGQVYNPLTRKGLLDRDVELMAAGMNKSYDGYMDVLIAAQVCRMCTGSPEAGKAALMLKDAVGKRNHYVADSWRVLSAAVADGTLPRKEGETLYGVMIAPFASYPDLTFDFLKDILKPRLTATEKATDAEVKANLALLERAFALYDKAQRPDLAVGLRMFQGQYLEAVGQKSKALMLYMTASQQYAKEHYGFIPLFERAVILLQEPENAKMRLKYLDYMATNVPEYKSDFNTQVKDVNPAYEVVTKVYVDALKATGDPKDAKKAADLEAKLPKG
jgi:hypothetical protein